MIEFILWVEGSEQETFYTKEEATIWAKDFYEKGYENIFIEEVE
jgi:hypothetical protein